jgi:hypothetical protein
MMPDLTNAWLEFAARCGKYRSYDQSCECRSCRMYRHDFAIWVAEGFPDEPLVVDGDGPSFGRCQESSADVSR